MSRILLKQVGKALLGAKKSHVFARNAKRFPHIRSGILGSFAQQFTAENEANMDFWTVCWGSGESQLYHHRFTRYKQLQR